MEKEENTRISFPILENWTYKGKMKAQVLFDINNLQLQEIDIPTLKPSEVLVKVHAAGICGSDIPRIYETGAHRHPLICGHEFSGEVVEVAEDVNNNWVGKKVGIFPLIPCNNCASCKNKKYEMCKNYNYLGSRCDGGFAEYAAVPEWNLIELPERVTYEQAAMLEPTAVAVHAFRGLDLQDKEAQICVCGLGTIGLLLTMILKQAGYNNLLLIGNKDFQKAAVGKMGIDISCYVDCTKNDISEWIMNKTENNGVDVFFECVGKNETLAQVIDLCAPAGQIKLVGNPHSDMSLDKNTYWKILRNQLTIKGSWNSSFIKSDDDDWNYALNLLENGSIHPEELITHEVGLEELEKGLHIMRDKSEDYIKIMCKMY